MRLLNPIRPMKKRIARNGCLLLFFFCCCIAYPRESMRYYFRTLNMNDGLSQNTVNVILQDRQGFMWFGTKDGLNRFDGLVFRIFRKENSALGNNFITALYEDGEGKIWVGTDAGVYVYDPVTETFAPFELTSDTGETVERTVTTIGCDSRNDIWIAADYQGLFRYERATGTLRNCLYRGGRTGGNANVTRFWFEGETCWVCLYDDNLYYTDDSFRTLHPFRDADGNEPFKDDIINTQVTGPYNRWYIGSAGGLTEVNRTTEKVTRLSDRYVRDLRFASDTELWAGTETGLYIYEPGKGEKAHLAASDGNDAYALADNALYALCRDNEGGMWIGSYFGGVNYYPRQWTYFEKFYPRDDNRQFGRRVREFCEDGDGMLWIGTEDKGLFRFDPATRRITPFTHPAVYRNVHGLCLDGNELWAGTFSGGLNRIDLRTGQVRNYRKGAGSRSLDANNVFTVYKTASGHVWIGTTYGLSRYNRATDDFTRIPELANVFVYKIHEDLNGHLWLATYSNGVFRYDVTKKEWKNYVSCKADSASLPYNKVISIYEDSRKRLWFATEGAGFCRYDPAHDNFVRYGAAQGFPGNTVYRMVEDNAGNLWLATNNGLVRFNPDTGAKRVYTTANGLLGNQFNYQSGYKDKQGRIYLGSIDGFVSFHPATFVENTYVPPVVITGFFLFNERVPVGDDGSPLKKSILFSDKIELESHQNSFSFQVAALSYQAPQMNRLMYKLDGFDKEWHAVGRNPEVAYSNLPYGTYVFRLKGSNSDGRWNETERVLTVRICPPFYLSGWAYGLYAVLALGALFALAFYFRQRGATRHRRQTEKFEQEKEREVYRAKIEFFTHVAHEIRTPLTLIKGPLENIMLKKEMDAETKEDLTVMRQNTERLLSLTNQLLDFRKTESRGYRLNFAGCDITGLLKETHLRFSSAAKQKKLEFTLSVPGEPFCAHVNREAFTKIISNLLNNAVKYAATYVHVSLEVEAAGEKRCFRIRTVNDGTVIPDAMKEEIFKPFVRFDGEGKGNLVPGTGIGLALSRSLAELHRGSLFMEKGEEANRFCLSLPVEQDTTISLGPGHGQEAESAVRRIAVPETNAAGANRLTVLLVEDNPEMLAFVSRRFAAGYTVLTATNGEEALAVLDGNFVNLIISDVVMPRMDGFELCKTVKSDVSYSHIPVVLLTAKTTVQSKIEGLELGADAYIDKPFSMEYLAACVANLIANREKLRRAFAQSPFVAANTMALTKADEEFIRKLNEVVLANLPNPEFSMEDMTDAFNMSRSNFYRKIKGVLDLSPNEYLRLERLKRAAQLLREGEARVSEICYAVGFNSPSYFSKCFQKQFGVLPKDFAG